MRVMFRPAFAARPSCRTMDGLAGLGGSITAMVTPFHAGALDADALAMLCDRQVQRGTSALVMCGSTGEAASLTPFEQMQAIRIACDAAAGRMPVIAGCTAPVTDAAVSLAEAAVRSGAGALLCAAPPYMRPSQDGIAAHVRAVAHAVAVPVILYDIPCRTGTAIADGTVTRLFEQGLIAGLKDGSGDLARPARLRGLCGPGLLQYSADDATAPAFLAMGGDGCMSAAANLVPALSARLHRAWKAADMAEAARLRDQLAPLHQALALESNPIPVKAALSLAGLCYGEMRLPLTRAKNATLDHLALLLPALIEAEEEAARPPRLSLVQ